MKTFKSAFVAFTLAEVLITLGIIGIVAAITIPTISKNIRHSELQQQFKKSYAVMSQAIAYTKMDLGTDNIKQTYTYHEGSTYVNAPEFINAFYNRLKIEGDKTYKVPRVNRYTVSPRNYTNTANAYWDYIGHENPSELLPDGSSVDCMINSGRINLSVDLNGPYKKPNRVGYDIFYFVIHSDNRLRPPKLGDLNTFYICDKTSTSEQNGMSCSYWAMIDKNPNDPTKGYWESLD